MEEPKVGASFQGQIYDVRTKRDGGGRIAIDFGMDGLEEIQWAQKVAAKNGCSFQIALVPVPDRVINCGHEEFIPNESGEIVL
jgi:hypothetical protein